MKKIIIIIVLFVFIFLFFLVSNIYQNDKYQNGIYNEIVSNYELDEDIIYFNKEQKSSFDNIYQFVLCNHFKYIIEKYHSKTKTNRIQINRRNWL